MVDGHCLVVHNHSIIELNMILMYWATYTIVFLMSACFPLNCLQKKKKHKQHIFVLKDGF